MRRILLFALIPMAPGGCAEPAAAPQPEICPLQDPEPEIPSVERVKDLLQFATKGCMWDRTEWAEEALIGLGDRTFPAYEAILSDPNCESLYTWQACHFLSCIETDRRHFIPLVMRRLREPDAMVGPGAVLHEALKTPRSPFLLDQSDITFVGVALACGESAVKLRGYSRRSAMRLIAVIGDDRQSAAVVPFLFDDDAYTRYTAAGVLAIIGDEWAVEAMNKCLAPGDGRRDANELQHITTRRNELVERLKKNPVRKYLTN